MSNIKVRKSGFGVVPIVAVVLVVLVIAGVGFVVMRKNNMSDTKAAATPTLAPTTTPQNSQTALQPQQAATTSNFDIKELRLRLTLPESLKDLKYTAKDVTLPNGTSAKTVYLSTTSLASADANCSAQAAPLGVMQVVQGQYPTGDPEAYFNYGTLLKQFPKFFVTYSGAQGSCTNSADTTVKQKFNNSAKNFKQAVKTTELENQ